MPPDSLDKAFARPDPESLLGFRSIGPVIFATVKTPEMTSIETPVIADVFQDAIRNAPAGTKQVVLDIERVKVVNSMALGMFVAAYTTALNRQISLILAGVSPAVMDILQLTKLETMLTVCQTPAELQSALSR